MTKSKAKTIEIFLPDGDPKSIKVASITSRTVEVTYIPRAKLEDAKKRDSLSGVGVYFLVGASEEHSKTEVYIGEAESCITRIGQHNANKDFWQYVLIVTSRTSQFTKTHGKYLEWLAYDSARHVGRCLLNNGKVPPKPHVSESLEADLYDSFDTISVLVSTLGLPIFQTARKQETSKEAEEKNTFSISRNKLVGYAQYTEEGVVVLAGSQFHKETTPSMQTQCVFDIRDKMLKDGILVDRGSFYELMEDTLLGSPSYAGACVTGRSTNGWKAWKLSNGSTLSDIYRSN